MRVGCSPAAGRLRQVEDSSEQNAAASSTYTAAPELPATALQQRPAKMFVAGSGGPVESGEGAALENGTNRLVKLATKVIADGGGILDLPAIERKVPLGYSLDDEEALGYLLGDALDHPLEEKGARAVGKRAAKHAKVIKKTLPEKASTARRDAKKVGACPDEAAQRAQADYLSEPFDTKCHEHPKRQPAAAQPSWKRKRKRVHTHPRWFVMPSADEVKAAMDAAEAAMETADEAWDVTALALKAAQSSLQKAQAALDELRLIPTSQILVMKPRELASFEAREERIEEKYDAANEAHAAADDAEEAAKAVLQQRIDELRRMTEWVKCSDRLTPFPWPGDEHIEPCNALDLDYYERRPSKCPAGVREWLSRYESYQTPECDHHVVDACDACIAAFDLGTMRSAEKSWRIPDI